MHFASVVVLALLGGLACGVQPSVGGSGGPPPRKIEPEEYSVTIRNNCPEPVELVASDAAPGDTAAIFRLSGSGIEQRTIGKRERVWLLYRGEWSSRRSARADSDGWVIEVVGSCDGVAGRSGPL